MKIESIETFTTCFVGLVRVTTDTGDQGWGQVSTYNSDISAAVLHRQVAPSALGQDISDMFGLGDLLDRIYETQHKFPGSYMCRALGGLDTAIWDLHGKIAEKPVVRLLGGDVGPVRAYASSMKRDITPEDELVRFTKLRDTCGFDAFKFRVGAEVGRNQDEWPGRTEEIVPKIRSGLGDAATLLVDANSCYSPQRAIEVAGLLADNGVNHFEEPCPYWDHDATKQVTEAVEIDVTGGEQDNDLMLWKYMIQNRVVDIVQPDISYVGGIERAIRVARMAQEAGLPCMPHAANMSLVTVFSAHFMAAIENAGDYLEFSIEEEDYYPWQRGVYTDYPTVRDGKFHLSDKPGWGIEIEPEWLAKAAYRISEQE
ncbi:MAG: mandelate racemase/muconate lactonizing enzyme family protein [Roseovarius sp.]